MASTSIHSIRLQRKNQNSISVILYYISLAIFGYLFYKAVLNQQINKKKDLNVKEQFIDYNSIMMDTTEVNKIVQLMSNVNTYAEWGTGGSTLNFPKLARFRAYAVEHNSVWCEKIQRFIDEDEKLSHVRYYCIPMEEDRWDRKSAPDGTYSNFRTYVNAVDHFNETVLDFVLIDGRSRLAVAIKILSYISSSSIVVLHDSERLYRNELNYSKILNFYSIVEKLQTGKSPGLAVLRRKPEYDALQGLHEYVQNILQEQYLFS